MIFRYGNFVIEQLEYLYALIPLMILLIYLLRKQYVKEDQRLFTTPGKKRLMLLSKLLIFALLVLALANPHIEYRESFTNITSIKILVDESDSMSIYDTSELQDITEKINRQGISTDIERLDMGEYSSIGSAVLNNLAPEENLLVVTDGQNNFGPDLEDVSLFAASINSKLFALQLEEEEEDARVIIEGPSKVVSGVENEFTISVPEIGNVGRKGVKITIDDRVIYDGIYLEEIELSERFSAGNHIIKAELDVGEDDYFPENNEFYKTVNVYEKPRLLFVTRKSSPLAELYDPFYSVVRDDSLDRDLDEFYAVILNDMDTRYLDEDLDKLEDYVSDGNGLFVVGGKNSYDWSDYNTSLLSNILPVSIGKASKNKDITNIVLLMDTGASSGEVLVEDITKFDVQKSLAADIVGSVTGTNRVAFIEANYYLNTLSPLSEVGPKRAQLINSISLLKPQGFSELRFAYKKAHEMLRLNKGSKNIVIITDGKLIPQDQAITLDYVEEANNAGIKTFVIAVGRSADETFLQQVKESGEGEFFWADETNKIKIYFGNPEKGTVQDLEIFVYDSNHFITDELEDLGNIYGFNTVYPKSTARLLLTTNEGDPVLTIWNYGLGRVASLSTDDGSTWVPDLLKSPNSVTLIRTLNWVIEDPERKSDIVFDIPPLRVGENSIVTVRTDSYPESQLNFYETSNNVFQANYYSNSTGIKGIMGYPVAVNYKKEYLNLGINENLERILSISSGEILENDENIAEKLKSLSEVETTKQINLAWVFISGAITIYLIELIIRRIIEIKERK